MQENSVSPAELASIECLDRVFDALAAGRNFLVEAGAGAGKTFTLIKALQRMIEVKGVSFLRSNKRIACITYTNVAKDEIRARTDNHPVIFAETIHAFAWNLIKDFQSIIRSHVPNLTEKWAVRVEEAGGVGCQPVIYNLGYPKITEDEIFLHHDDVIRLLVLLLEDGKFKRIVTNRFPVIFIDEYQDTNKDLANSLIRNFIVPSTGPLIGFFGDHWQKIYGTNSIGLIEVDADKLENIGKGANFRSDRVIVEALNNIRPELPQHVKDPQSCGEIVIYHSNQWQGVRRPPGPGGHWSGDLPETVAHDYLLWTMQVLEERGWNFDPESTKILMLTHNVLAAEQGYSNILSVVGQEDLFDKNDDYVSFLADTVEPGATAFLAGKYGQMLASFRLSAPSIQRHSDKLIWDRDVRRLVELRQTGTIGEVIDLLKETRRPRLSRKIEDKENRFLALSRISAEDREESEQRLVDKVMGLRAVRYSELINVNEYIDDKTLFSTKHGVKGAEFENVLIVLGRGWSLYNWNQMLEWADSGIPSGRTDSFERNRNLFYVACSRPKRRLAMLFTQELSVSAINTLNNWFGSVVSPISM